MIRAGLIDINKPEMMLESTEVYIYPTFNVSNPMSAQVNDIAMIKLPTPLEYSRMFLFKLFSYLKILF